MSQRELTFSLEGKRWHLDFRASSRVLDGLCCRSPSATMARCQLWRPTIPASYLFDGWVSGWYMRWLVCFSSANSTLFCSKVIAAFCLSSIPFEPECIPVPGATLLQKVSLSPSFLSCYWSVNSHLSPALSPRNAPLTSKPVPPWSHSPIMLLNSWM